MKTAYFDCFAGIAGDMAVGALLDAGADAAALFGGLESLGTGARFSAEKVKRNGIAGTKFHVEHEDQKKHRHLPHIVKMIEGAALPARAQRNAIAIFNALGEAEAKVHGVAIEKVHFHEVGAVDSICDIVGAAFGLELLGVEEIYASPVNTGSGTVEADHGVMPVPAPATAVLLTGKPAYARGPETELTTPTGAAILAGLAKGLGPMPAMSIERSGFGAGAKEFPEMANLLRVLIGERSGAAESVAVAILEANIDDSTPEVLGYAMERLLESGALDVTMSPLLMKKQRPGVRLEIVCAPEDRDRMASITMAETSTLGLRMWDAERRVMARQHEVVDLGYAKVRIKVSPSGAAPEFDDCRKAALSAGKPLKEVMAAALAAWLRK